MRYITLSSWALELPNGADLAPEFLCSLVELEEYLQKLQKKNVQTVPLPHVSAFVI